MILMPIGYWLGEFEPGWPNVESFIDRNWSSMEREAVVRWLESGVVVRRCRGYATCRICKQRNGSTEVSDGVYMWPGGLSHYVREHHVRLPAIVIAHALHSPAIDRNRLESVERENEEILVDEEPW